MKSCSSDLPPINRTSYFSKEFDLGMNFANAIAQLGVVPRQLLIHFGMIFFAMFFVTVIQSHGLKLFKSPGRIADSSL